MRKKIMLSLAMFAFAAQAFASSCNDDNKNCTDDVFGHTFYTVRPLYQTAMPEKETMFRDRIDAKCDGFGGAFQAVFFGSRSGKSKALGKWFSPCPKDELVVRSGDTNGLDRDINPEHFGIPGDFESTIKFRPRQTVFGVGLTYRQYLASSCSCEKNWWLELSTPIYHVKNDMRLTEDVVTSGTHDNCPQSMIEAFKGEKFCIPANPDPIALEGDDLPQYGLICGSQKRTRLADIELKVGYDWIDECECYFASYFGLLIPAGTKPKAKYVFEPIVGHNFNFAFELGHYFGFEIWNECDRSLRIEAAIDGKYFVSNTQRRSFDLKARPWSRYMLVFKDADAQQNTAPTPGINVFTRKMKVRPGFAFNTNVGLVYDSCGFRAEVGHNLYARQCERVCLKEAWVEGAAVADLVSPGDVNLLSNIASDNLNAEVGYDADGDDRTVIRATDLDLGSAAHVGALSNTIYGSLGYHWDDACYPTFVGLGGSYEFARKNTVLSRWTVWGKFGFSV